MGLQRFERRLERLVEGGFGKAFRTGLQPVEIGRRLVRELESGRSLGVRGTVAPNRFTVRISEADRARFEGFQDALVAELTETVRDAARASNYRFAGPVEVSIAVDPRFGPVVACGAGGIEAELLNDVAVRVSPLTDLDAREMIRSLATYPRLDGYRGAPMADDLGQAGANGIDDRLMGLQPPLSPPTSGAPVAVAPPTVPVEERRAAG